jgi:glycosyltransferase involved in cell wall biosynthesis
MLSFDFAEVCSAIAGGLSRSADVSLWLPQRLAESIRDELDSSIRLSAFALPRLRQPLRQVRTCAGIVRSITRFDPDVVHLQAGHLWFNAGLPFLRRPLVVTLHDVLPHPGDRASEKTPPAVIRFGYRRATEIIVHAEHIKKEAATRLARPPETIHVIPHVAIGPTAQGRWEEGDGRSVLFFGRIWPYKGLEWLIRAEPLVTERVPDARFIIAGKGEDVGRYRRMMRDPSRYEIVNEFVSVKRRSALLARAAVVVLPYVEASQSGVVPLASAFETPVVATAVGGLPEAVEHGRTGLIVPPRDHRALADAIIRLLTEPVLARELGVAARGKLERECSPTVVAEKTLRVYEAAVARHG